MNSLYQDRYIMEIGLEIIDGSNSLYNFSQFAIFNKSHVHSPLSDLEMILINRLLIEYSLSAYCGIDINDLEELDMLVIKLEEDLLFNDINLIITDIEHNDTYTLPNDKLNTIKNMAYTINLIHNSSLSFIPRTDISSIMFVTKWYSDYMCEVTYFYEPDDIY